MSNLKQKIEADVKESLRQRDSLRLSVLRMLLASLHNREIEKRTKGQGEELTEEETIATLRSEVKKRRDSIQEFSKGGRTDLAGKEAAELAILEKYLPAELADEDLEKIVFAALQSLGPVTPKDFGRVMGAVMKETKGQASGDRVSRMVNKFLKINNAYR